MSKRRAGTELTDRNWEEDEDQEELASASASKVADRNWEEEEDQEEVLQLASASASKVADRNWEEEEDQEEVLQPGSFGIACEETLTRRVIRKAKRRVKVGEEDDSKQHDDTPKPSPFAGFAFGANKPSSTGFSFKSTKTDTQTEPLFSFKPSVPDKPPVTAIAGTVPMSSTAPSLPSFGSVKSSTLPISTNGAGSTTALTTTSNPYTQKLQNLNRSVSAWIQKHVTENPVCDLTPVFEDYKKHLREIEKLRAENMEVTKDTGTLHAEIKSDTVTIPPSATSTFSFGESDIKHDGKQSDSATVAPSASSTFLFGKSSEDGQPKSDFSFKVSTAGTTAGTPSTTSGFSFGRSDTVPESVGSSAGKLEKTEAGSLFGSVKPFSFGLVKSSDAPKPASEGTKPAGDDDYEPPKEEIKTVQEKESLHSKRCKLFYKKGDAYKDRGVGMLHLKKLGKMLQLLVRADTNLGNVILNITLPDSLPVTREGKNNLIVMTPINPPVDRTCPQCNKKYPRPQESNACDSGCIPEATALLIRVKTGAEADKVLEKINELRAV